MFCAILSIKFRLESVINCFGPLPPAENRRDWRRNISSSVSGSICLWQGRRPGPAHQNCSQVYVWGCVRFWRDSWCMCHLVGTTNHYRSRSCWQMMCTSFLTHSSGWRVWRTQIDNKRQRMGKLLGRTMSSVSLSLWVERNHAGLTFPLRPLLGAPRHHGFG